MTTTVVADLFFPESPRWRDGRLFFSDMGARRVLALEPSSGRLDTVLPKVPGAPSGITWDDEGRLLVVSMARQLVYRDDGGDQLTRWVDLSAFGGGWRNDAVRHPAGWLYVGAVGEGTPPLADLVLIRPDGSAAVAAEGLNSPNGMVITDDGATLMVDEHHAGRVSAFAVGDDGMLHDRRTWAEAPGWLPDGCCLDADGAMWIASAGDPVVRRVADGGEVLDTVTVSQPAFACMLGGHDRRTLYVCTAPGSDEDSRAAGRGRIEAVQTAVPGAGWP